MTANSATVVAAADEAAANLYSTVKLTKMIFTEISACPEHPDQNVCGCDEALSAMPEDARHKAITLNFIAPFEAYLLSEPTAFAFTGDQASHHAFQKMGKGLNPKKFIRCWLENESYPFHELFDHKNRKEDTINAMLDLWVARNAQWKQVYETHEQTQKCWMQDTYAGPAAVTKQALLDAAIRKQNPLGAKIRRYDFVIHPDDNEDGISTIKVLPQAFRKFKLEPGQPAYEIEAMLFEKTCCHDDMACQIATANRIQEAWKEVLQDVAAKQFLMRREAVDFAILEMSEWKARVRVTISRDPRGDWYEDEKKEHAGDEIDAGTGVID